MNTEASRLQIVPITFKQACEFVKKVHRHHKPPIGHKFSIGLEQGGELKGVVIASRPTARMSDDGKTIEVTRLATDGTRNACSMLYRAAWRTAIGMGYKRLLTYTLPEEGGASLLGAGFECLGTAGGGSWSRKTRHRDDKHPLQEKTKWQLTLN